ncbi:MAG: sigma-70 family RNA polymerase sigma factor [Alphaproteobacteria bacterium]|nr:sigma-70 family RNA polymerase sigma factor [Alphaproteobacteria bacterium]
MFRISKSDDHIERCDPEDETTSETSSPEGSGGAVAASALRWLTGSKKHDERSDVSDESSQATAQADRSETDDLEHPLDLTAPLDPDAPQGNDDEKILRTQAPTSPSTAVVKVQTMNGGGLPFDLYDIDDDIGDFDDIGTIEDVAQPRPIEKTPFFPSIDLDDISSPDELDASLPLAVNLAEADEFVPSLAPPYADEIAETDQPAEVDLTGSSFDPLTDQPSADQPPDAEARSDACDEQALAHKLDEAPITALDTSLALQPIPELQTEPRPPLKKPSKPMGSEGAPSQAFGDEDADDMAGTALADLPTERLTPIEHLSPIERLFDDDVDLDTDLLAADIPAGDTPGIERLEIEALDMASADQTDDHITNDWHAHLAHVLGGERDMEEAARSDLELADQAPLDPATDVPSADRNDDPSVMLPLSKTLARLATASEPEDDDLLLSPLLTQTPRQNTYVGQPPSTLPADTSDLSAEQLSLGIIANVPRLRRFAAVQIGDELVADQLVQSTIETVLGDPSALQPASDLGLALITLLYQRRQEMLGDPTAPQRSPEAARAFEIALCRGLAGADQFEIHQFAQAINRLDERDRELLVLVALENLTYNQIADMIQISTERVMTMVASARINLRQTLAADESAGSAVNGTHAQEIEIHGYLDGELDGRHMADVDALVEHDEDAANRLLHYGIQGDLIRRLYAPLLNRPISGKMLGALSAAAKPAARWGFRFGPRKALIAGAFLLALGAIAAWPHISPLLNGVISDAMAISSAAIH